MFYLVLFSGFGICFWIFEFFFKHVMDQFFGVFSFLYILSFSMTFYILIMFIYAFVMSLCMYFNLKFVRNVLLIFNSNSMFATLSNVIVYIATCNNYILFYLYKIFHSYFIVTILMSFIWFLNLMLNGFEVHRDSVKTMAIYDSIAISSTQYHTNLILLFNLIIKHCCYKVYLVPFFYAFVSWTSFCCYNVIICFNSFYYLCMFSSCIFLIIFLIFIMHIFKLDRDIFCAFY